MATYIGEAEIATGIAVSQLFVIKPHQVKDGGMKVMDVDFVFDRFETEVIGCAVRSPLLYAGAEHPNGVGVRVVVTPESALLVGRHAAEFRRPKDKRVLQQAARLEIANEARCWLVEDR